jgi:CMP-N-acetylneuraminic acid synthetase
MPILGRTIQNLRNSQIFSEIFVSTEDREIAEIAVGFGARVEPRRSIDLSDDYTPTKPVVVDAIKNFNISDSNTLICVVYSTSVLIGPNQYIDASKIAISLEEGEQLLAIKRFSHPIERSFIVSSSGALEYKWPNNAQKRTQDFPTSYYDCGQFYWATRNTWMSSGEIRKRIGFELGTFDAIDVDEVSDLKDLERIIELKESRN